MDYQFEDFELYYRFYTLEQTPNESLTDRTGLLAAGFKRVTGSDDPAWDGLRSTKPLIAVDWDYGNTITFRLDFAASGEPAITNNRDSTTIVMRRQPKYSSLHELRDQFKSFVYDLTPDPSYTSSDDDLGTAVWDQITARNDVQLTVYVLSYGIQDVSTELYSDAVCLFSITGGTTPFGW